VDAAVSAFPAGFRYLVATRFVLATVGSLLVIILLALPPANAYFRLAGGLRVVTVAVSDQRLIERAVEKIRQAGRGMPAVMIRQLEMLARIMEQTKTERQRDALCGQAMMILQASETSVPAERDRADIRRAYDAVTARRNFVTDGRDSQTLCV
jgi:uncharacterized membrane protein